MGSEEWPHKTYVGASFFIYQNLQSMLGIPGVGGIQNESELEDGGDTYVAKFVFYGGQ